MMIREGVAMHAFNGELFVQATGIPVRRGFSGHSSGWSARSASATRTIPATAGTAVPVCRLMTAVRRWDITSVRTAIRLDAAEMDMDPRELPGGRASFIHVFEPVEDGQTRGANVFYSVMEQMKMLDTLQNTQLQSAIVKAMYAATIESELDTQSAMDFILGANSKEQRDRLTGWIGEIAAYYAAAPVRLGGAKVPHLMPGDSLNLQTAQDTDNGYSVFEQSLLRYIAAGLGVSYEQLSRNYAQMSYSTARASANESWAYFMGRRKFVASRQASQMFLCWLEEAIARRVVTLPSKARFSFQEARSARGTATG